MHSTAAAEAPSAPLVPTYTLPAPVRPHPACLYGPHPACTHPVQARRTHPHQHLKGAAETAPPTFSSLLLLLRLRLRFFLGLLASRAEQTGGVGGGRPSALSIANT